LQFATTDGFPMKPSTGMKLENGIGMHATDPCHNANISQAKWTELSAASVPMVFLHYQPPAESFLSKNGYFSTKKSIYCMIHVFMSSISNGLKGLNKKTSRSIPPVSPKKN